MAETTKDRLATLEQEREAYFQEHQSDIDFVAMMKEKARLNTKGIVIAAVCAAVIMIGATWGLHAAAPELGPMWMWLTIGLPAVAAAVYTIVMCARHEKYTEYAKEADRGIADVRAKLFAYDQEIDRLKTEAENQ